MGRRLMQRARRRLAVVSLLAAMLLVGGASAGAAGGTDRPVGTWAYYYIWFNASSWNRAKLDFPLLGRYSSDEPTVMRDHIRLAKRAGIDGFIVSWKSTPVLDRRLALLAEVAARERFHLALMYQGLDFARRPQSAERVSMDLDRFERSFARLPAFGASAKPLVVWSGTWEFSAQDLASVTSAHRDRLRILASERNAPDYKAKASAFDGDAYYWSSVNPDTYPRYHGKLEELASAVHDAGGLWIAPAAAGFDGTLVGHPTVVPRRDGETLRRELDAAQRSQPDAIGIISWNEFSENSHVEPSRRYGTKALEVLADVQGTRFKATGDLDSSQPDGRGQGMGAIPATLAFIVLAVAGVHMLHRRRSSAAT